MTETEPTWSFATAEAQFDDVVDRAVADGPQTIDGEEGALVVVVSGEEWRLLSQGEACPESVQPPNADPTGSSTG